MRYSLVIRNNNNEIFEVKKYSELLCEEEKNENKLETICDFTSNFNSQDDLMQFLYSSNRITDHFIYGKPEIAFFAKKGAKPKILSYGVHYKDEDYLFNLTYLEQYYLHHLTDIKLMDKLINRYLNYLENVPHLGSDLLYLNYYLQTYKQTGYKDPLAETAITSFIHRYSTKKDKNGKVSIRYRQLRDLAMIAIDNERNKNEVIDDEIMLDYYNYLIKEDNLTDNQKEYYEGLRDDLEMKLCRRR